MDGQQNIKTLSTCVLPTTICVLQYYKQHVFLRLRRNAFNMLLLTASYEDQQCLRNTFLLLCYRIAPQPYAVFTFPNLLNIS